MTRSRLLWIDSIWSDTNKSERTGVFLQHVRKVFLAHKGRRHFIIAIIT